jgi:hypothetical protein
MGFASPSGFQAQGAAAQAAESPWTTIGKRNAIPFTKGIIASRSREQRRDKRHTPAGRRARRRRSRLYCSEAWPQIQPGRYAGSGSPRAICRGLESGGLERASGGECAYRAPGRMMPPWSRRLPGSFRLASSALRVTSICEKIERNCVFRARAQPISGATGVRTQRQRRRGVGSGPGGAVGAAQGLAPRAPWSEYLLSA